MGFRISFALRTGALVAALSASLWAQAPAAREESKGLPARTSPAEYQAQGKAGGFTIGAEFVGHSIPTPKATYSSEDYVVVEVGLFGPEGARLKLAMSDFSLRINGKKNALPREPYDLVFHNLKDPEWEPLIKPEGGKQSKTSIGSQGGGGGGDKPPPPKMPIAERRAMEQAVQRASLLEGDRALPQAGLIFFGHRGKITGIQSLELMYDGPAGKASVALQP